MEQTMVTLKQIGKRGGISEQDVEACEQNQRCSTKLTADQGCLQRAEGGFHADLFINGEKVKGAMSFEELEAKIKAAAEEVATVSQVALPLFCSAPSPMMAPTRTNLGRAAMRPVLRACLAAVLLLSGVVASLAQGYPNRPVRVVVGFRPAVRPTSSRASWHRDSPKPW